MHLLRGISGGFIAAKHRHFGAAEHVGELARVDAIRADTFHLQAEIDKDRLVNIGKERGQCLLKVLVRFHIHPSAAVLLRQIIQQFRVNPVTNAEHKDTRIPLVLFSNVLEDVRRVSLTHILVSIGEEDEDTRPFGIRRIRQRGEQCIIDVRHAAPFNVIDEGEGIFALLRHGDEIIRKRLNLVVKTDEVEPVSIVEIAHAKAECLFRLRDFLAPHASRPVQHEDKIFLDNRGLVHLISRREGEHEIAIFLPVLPVRVELNAELFVGNRVIKLEIPIHRDGIRLCVADACPMLILAGNRHLV